MGILLLFMLHSRAETSDTIPPHAARSVTLDEVVVVGGREEAGSRLLPSLNVVRVGLDRMDEQRAGSLMQTLDGVPGVRAMHIGSGQSKPLIRGMGFNRVLVVENGLRHEGQQWGDDHGLEIDQFADAKEKIIRQIRGLHNKDYVRVLYKVYVQYKSLKVAAAEMKRSYNYTIEVHRKALEAFEKVYSDLVYLC